MNSGRATERIEGALARVGLTRAARLARDRRGRTVRVLVTGATGFTGGHLARAPRGGGDDGRALTRSAAARAHGCRHRDGRSDDLRDPPRSSARPAGVDVVYHIAAIYRQAGFATGVPRGQRRRRWAR